MARVIKFQTSTSDVILDAELESVTRDKLYGSKTVEHTTQDNQPLYAGAIADNRIILPTQSQEQGYITPLGYWYDRADLVPVNQHGEPLEKQPSTLDKPIKLEATLPLNWLLKTKTKTVYTLYNYSQALLDMVKERHKTFYDCYCFDFNFTASHIVDMGVLMASDEDKLFVLVTVPVDFDPLTQDDFTVEDIDTDQPLCFDF